MSARFNSLPILPLLCVLALPSGCPAQTSAPTASPHTFTVSGRQFLLDGKPYQIISGSMHYTRIPRAYWRDRLHKARAMGLNTITTYVFWNVHEPRPGVFDFSGQNDIAEYIREAQEEGLHVILRPGPYVCAEWDLGGFPSWLLKDRSLILRSMDPNYLAAVKRWFARLGKEIHPLLLHNGGPIIAIQVENEYGSFGNDRAYMEEVKDILLRSGMDAPVLYTADGPEEIPDGALPELPAVINFGSGEAQKSFAILHRLRPDGPSMTGEYWDGWFDHWGETHHVTDAKLEAAELEWMLKQGYSVNLYMFHGGTSFGWMNGANSDGQDYQPDTTSYDYDAPLDEHGAPREKFFLFPDVIARTTGQTLPPLPPPIPTRSFPVSTHLESASLWNNLPVPVVSNKLLTMEDLDQSYGYILYRTELKPQPAGDLVIDRLHDYAQVYIDQKLVGALDRRVGTSRLALPPIGQHSTLDILVENSGRVNFTKVIREERKGITGNVTIAGHHPEHWNIYSLPMNDVNNMPFAAKPCSGPCFYRAEFIADSPADSFLDTSTLHKGFVWLNGRPLGRFWDIGPQFSLYAPASWMKQGANDIVFFELRPSGSESIATTTAPIFKVGSAQGK